MLWLVEENVQGEKNHTFVIYGEEVASQPGGLPKAYFTSRGHIWSDVAVAKLPGPQPHNDSIEVKARCVKKKKARGNQTVDGDGTDDLTVTLVFTDGGTEEINECCFEDVTYEDP